MTCEQGTHTTADSELYVQENAVAANVSGDAAWQSKMTLQSECEMHVNLMLLPEYCRRSIIVFWYACRALNQQVVEDFACGANLAPLCTYIEAKQAHSIDTPSIRNIRKKVSRLMHSDKTGQHSEIYSQFNNRIDICTKLPSAQDWTSEYEMMLNKIELQEKCASQALQLVFATI